jgi:L-lactate dehydrogenase
MIHHMPMTSHKISIIGAGSVGATIAYACLIRGVARNIALFDINRAKVDAEVLDLNHGLQFLPASSLQGSDDLSICADSEIIVVTAGAKQKPGQSRLDLAAANTQICRDLIPKLQSIAPSAILLLVTNPVDVLTYIVQKISALPPNRVIGSGTVLDSSRFRFLIAQRCKVAVQNVHAYIAGEHGDSEIPLWSSATIANIPLHEWAVPGHGKLSIRDRTEIFQNVKTAAAQVIAGKGATNYAIGLATSKIIEALLHDENRVLSVSSLLTNFHEISNVCLSVPAIVNRNGVEQALPTPMNENELAGLRNSAETLQRAIRSLGF